MSVPKPPLNLKFYGVSPWELEVLYSLLNSLFQVQEDKQDQPDEDFSTRIEIVFPIAFNEAFFKWFGRPRWDKTKAVLKEFKRRRGGGRSLRVYMTFTGKPNIKFLIDLGDKHLFDSSIDKMDFVLELLPYHLDPQKMPEGVKDVVYSFDDTVSRWRVSYDPEEHELE